MDDRILLIPSIAAPDPAVYEHWPALHALRERLDSFLPVDTLLWPTLKGQPREGSPAESLKNAVRRQIRPEHHVLAFVCTEPLLAELCEGEVRSLITTPFVPAPNSMSARGDGTLEGAMRAMVQLMANPSQFVRLTMTGAAENVVTKTVEEVERTLDRAASEKFRGYEWLDLKAPGTLPVPALYLTAAALTPGRDEVFDYFRSLVPNTKLDQLQHFGPRLHEEAGGHELAGKVIPFIEAVIAARDGG
jgi:hypothetical protein